MSPRVAFMTVQYEHVQTGPGTFANYVEAHSELDLTIFSQDIAAPDRQHRRVESSRLEGWPGGQFARSYAYHRAVAQAPASAFDLIWYNTSPKTGFFSAVLDVGIPVVLMINDYNNAISRYPLASRDELGTGQSLMRPVWRLFEQWALHACDGVVVNSRFMKRFVQQEYDLPEDKLYLLYKAVDVETFSFTLGRSFGSPVRVLFVKHDYVRGGLDELIEALSQLSVSTVLTIAGPAEHDFSSIRAMVKTHGYLGEVNMLGPVGRDQVRALYQSHDVFCVPSRAEALGVVFLEALASGIPALGARAGGIPEVLDDGRAGWLAPPQDATALRHTLEAILQRPEERKRRVRYGRTHAEQFSLGRMVRRMKDISQRIVYNQSPPRA